MPPSEQDKSHAFQAPKGTRDLYPQDLLKRRYIEKMWRDTAVRHGFEEIDGPTFEHLDLYTVKSGEGIVSELFSFRREGGEKDYALRPEFTPTLARMYAAKAGSLPRPTKWFWQQNCFRAERPQRGRLREFGQWNVDVIGGEDSPESKAAADAEVIACTVGLFQSLGLSPKDVRVEVSSRTVIQQVMVRCGLPEAKAQDALVLLDKRAKMPAPEFRQAALQLGLDIEQFDERTKQPMIAAADDAAFAALWSMVERSALSDWCDANFEIARGLAYYTGMVFEVHEAGGKERAIAGGGRYDNLIQLFGGPPTPAVGFGMGDVVLSLVLEDRGLMPQGAALLDKLSEPPASLRPDIFVISNGQDESERALRPLVAQLRRGGAGEHPLHARHTYKTTKNIGKLLQEAASQHARYAAIIESASEATLKNLSTGDQQKLPLADLAAKVS